MCPSVLKNIITLTLTLTRTFYQCLQLHFSSFIVHLRWPCWPLGLHYTALVNAYSMPGSYCESSTNTGPRKQAPECLITWLNKQSSTEEHTHTHIIRNTHTSKHTHRENRPQIMKLVDVFHQTRAWPFHQVALTATTQRKTLTFMMSPLPGRVNSDIYDQRTVIKMPLFIL